MVLKDPNLYQAPKSYLGYVADEPERDWKWLFFSFEGRLSRGKYWIGSMVGILPLLVVGAITASSFLDQMANFDQNGDSPLRLPELPLLVALGVLFLQAMWTQLAVSVKRWHDRGKSGLWMFIGFIPYVGSIWTMIELGCLRGTDGPNAFGPDPLA